MHFFTAIFNTVSIKKIWIVVLALGWVLSFSMLVIYDRQKSKTNQYAELNTFLTQRLKTISGERTKLEISLQEAITKGLNTQTNIEKANEKDFDYIHGYFDTLNTNDNKKFFERNYGKVGQRKLKKR